MSEASDEAKAYVAWQHQQAMANAYARHWGLPYTSAGMENVYGLSGGLGGSLGGQGQLAQSLEPVQHLASMNARLADLQREISVLHQQLGAVRSVVRDLSRQLDEARRKRERRETRVASVMGKLDTMLKDLIVLAHPDKWPGNPLAHEITVVLNRVREEKYRV
jgi:hypothetical protein